MMESMVIWSNVAFIPDDVEGINYGYDHSSDDESSSYSSFCTRTINQEREQEEEEIRKKIREEELEKEIEKEVEQEIMEGILVLVKKLSKLKAKQIIRSLKKLNLEGFLNVLHGSYYKSDSPDEHDDVYWRKSSTCGHFSSHQADQTEFKFSDNYEFFVEEEQEGSLEDTDKYYSD